MTARAEEKTSFIPVKLTPDRIKIELLAGLTVALALVPEAVAFAFVAGVNPLVGLYAAFFIGLITAVFGGRPGMISGATGALAVVMVSLVADHGVEYLFATVVLMGIMQVIFGALRWGKFIRMVPHPVMLGFVNGLAIVIFLAQLGQFQIGTGDASGGHGPGLGGEWLPAPDLIIMLGLVALTMLIIWGLPKFTKVIPAPLAAILVVSFIVIGFGVETRSVGDLASIAGGLPQVHIPMVPLNFETLEIIFPYALILSAIGLIESLLTHNLVSDMTGTKGGASKECVAQGAANIITGFFGGMGGCAMIGQSMINVKSGARTRIAGIAAALFLLSFILFASPLIEQIPVAALVGVMFMVVVGTFAWRSFRIMRKIPLTDAIVIIVVTVVTVFADLAVAVVVGVIMSALAYAWNAASRIYAGTGVSKEGWKVYRIEGPLFFGSSTGFVDLFDPENDPEDVVVDFINSRVVDHSGIEAIESIAAKYRAVNKRLHLRHLSPDCERLLEKAGDMVEISVLEDPDYSIAVDYGDRFKEKRLTS
ncbi:SulP family inorganic anion transporter [Ponticaulis koreensis]|uniref:SulP family inorganic anion transporter n=1 Tax=Ponticaulis koreensis TaxID=1123045 RepID=UPI0003B785D5|nr:SulP family inorganic anion transporter [Ponticaulis koreensis]